MKRLFSWILLLGVVLTSLVSCSEVDPTLSLPATDGEKTSNLPLTDDTTSEPISPDGKHIALGGDLDGCDKLPKGFDGIQSYPDMADRLVARGVGEDTVMDIFWNNAFGVMHDAICNHKK